MNKVTVEISPMLQKIARSPVYFLVAALQGVSISFAPLFLYWCGTKDFLKPHALWIVPLCFLAIWIVGFFYIFLGSPVVKELRRGQIS